MSDDRVEAVDDALTGLRRAVRDQLGVERPPPADVDPDSLVRFSDELPRRSTRRARAARPRESRSSTPGSRARSCSAATS